MDDNSDQNDEWVETLTRKVLSILNVKALYI